jgi:uncharacterized protein (UPF0305 family)
MSKSVKLDPTKVTYNGKSVDLVIEDRNKFLSELQAHQKDMESKMSSNNTNQNKAKTRAEFKSTVLKILKDKTQEMSNRYFHGSNRGVSEDEYEDAADEIVQEYQTDQNPSPEVLERNEKLIETYRKSIGKE